jgi:hypothetical protein
MSHRPLPAVAVLALALCTGLGLEGLSRKIWGTQDGLRERASQFNATARPEDKNLVILGTCLPAQHVHTPELQAGLGGGWVVHNLGNEATSPLDWYLAYANALDTRRVQAVIVGYGDRDLQASVSPWESRVLDLARWDDVPEMAGFACHDAECRTDLMMRAVSVLWRNRIRMSNRVWLSLGALPREAPEAPPVSDRDDGAALHYLERLVAAAKEDGTPLWLLPLPGRPGRQVDNRAVPPTGVLPSVARLEIPPLGEDAFSDDTHLTEAGSRIMTAELARATRLALDLPEPPPVDSRPAGPRAEPRGPPLPGR